MASLKQKAKTLLPLLTGESPTRNKEEASSFIPSNKENSVTIRPRTTLASRLTPNSTKLASLNPLLGVSPKHLDKSPLETKSKLNVDGAIKTTEISETRKSYHGRRKASTEAAPVMMAQESI
jgi:hypothetical protein